MATNVAQMIDSVDDARDLLRKWREDNVRHSEEVLELWLELLRDELGQLEDERWMICEQVAVAAMDCHRPDVVDDCLELFAQEFEADSFRVRRIYAMREEMEENWERALLIYDSILEADETNSSARKRKVAIHKALNDVPKAIAELNKYLRDFMSDQEAWMELCDLYISEQDYAKAAFCCEEVLLQNPHNHLYFQRYAEIRYTQGGFDNLELAKTYYSQAIRLNPENARALYGLLLTSNQLASSPKCTAPKKKEYLKSVLWTRNQISEKYTAKVGQVPPGLMDGIMASVAAV